MPCSTSRVAPSARCAVLTVSTVTLAQISSATPRQSKPGPRLAEVAGVWTVNFIVSNK